MDSFQSGAKAEEIKVNYLAPSNLKKSMMDMEMVQCATRAVQIMENDSYHEDNETGKSKMKSEENNRLYVFEPNDADLYLTAGDKAKPARNASVAYVSKETKYSSPADLPPIAYIGKCTSTGGQLVKLNKQASFVGRAHVKDAIVHVAPDTRASVDYSKYPTRTASIMPMKILANSNALNIAIENAILNVNSNQPLASPVAALPNFTPQPRQRNSSVLISGSITPVESNSGSEINTRRNSMVNINSAIAGAVNAYNSTEKVTSTPPSRSGNAIQAKPFANTLIIDTSGQEEKKETAEERMDRLKEEKIALRKIHYKKLLYSTVVTASAKAARVVEFLEDSLTCLAITCSQLAILVRSFPQGEISKFNSDDMFFGTYRVELIISLFNRVIDIHNFYLVLNQVNNQEYAALICRVGILNIFNPLLPEGIIIIYSHYAILA